jgi:hypothetical protein
MCLGVAVLALDVDEMTRRAPTVTALVFAVRAVGGGEDGRKERDLADVGDDSRPELVPIAVERVKDAAAQEG